MNQLMPALITFTDDYLQPGLIKHNRPFFISGYLNGLEITRIMIDGGSAQESIGSERTRGAAAWIIVE